MLNQQQLEELGFSFPVCETTSPPSFSWLFQIGRLSSATPFNRNAPMTRESAQSYQTLQQAIDAAVVACSEFDLAKCDNCSHVCDVSALGEVKDMLDRHDPGGEFALGECPECGSLSYKYQAVPPFHMVADFYGLDSSFSYGDIKKLDYMRQYQQQHQKDASEHQQECVMGQVKSRLAQLIVSAEIDSQKASLNGTTSEQVGAHARINCYKKAFLVAINQAGTAAGYIQLEEALLKARTDLSSTAGTVSQLAPIGDKS